MHARTLLLATCAAWLATTSAHAAASDATAEGPSTLVTPPTAHTLGVRRATQREVGIFLPGTRLVDPAGVAVARLAATDDPDSREDDDQVTVVAVDRGAGTIFTSLGMLRVVKWSGADTRIGALSRPTDVALDRSGLVGVTDTGNGRVVVLRHDGKSLTPLAAHGGFGEPLGIAADGAGGFLVCDRKANAVFRLNAESGARSTFGLEAAFDRPIDVAMVPEGQALAADHAPAIVVVDRDGGRIRVFDPAGSVRAARDASSFGVAHAAFDAVELDNHGNVFVVDRKGSRVHKFREDLLPLATFGSRGTNPGQFLNPRGIAIYRRFGQVFVSEEDGGQYLWLGTDVDGFGARSERGGIRFDYLLTEESFVVLRILNGAGKTVATILDQSRQREGPQRGFWDGTDEAGQRVPAGSYSAEIRARATYASKGRFERVRTVAFTLPAVGAH